MIDSIRFDEHDTKDRRSLGALSTPSKDIQPVKTMIESLIEPEITSPDRFRSRCWLFFFLQLIISNMISTFS